ncbi:hypothetical protein [uncultured Fibrella sp.]
MTTNHPFSLSDSAAKIDVPISGAMPHPKTLTNGLKRLTNCVCP